MSSVPSVLPIFYSNFQEIYAAVTRDDTEQLQLSSSDGIQIEKKDSVFQIFKDLIYENKVHEALANTAQQFRDLQEEWITPQLTFYETYLRTLTNDPSAKLEEPHSVRTNILNWYDRTTPLLELQSGAVGSLKLSKLLHTYFSGLQPFSHENNDKVARCATIIRMESTSLTKLPLHDWFRIVRNGDDPLKVRSHKEWVHNYLRNGKNRASAFNFYREVEAVMEFFKSIETNPNGVPPNSAEMLVYSLWIDGHTAFIREADEEHLQWRKELRTGDALGVFTITGRYFESGKKRSVSVFRLNDPSYVAKIFANRAITFMYEYSLKKTPLDIPLPQTIHVDPQGRFSIQERFDDPAATLDKVNVTRIGDKEKQSLAAAVRIMQYFIYNDWCPSISLGYFRVTASNELRCLRPYEKKDHWLEPYEDYAREISQGNKVVYRYLIDAAKIQDTDNYRLYSAVVEDFAAGIENYFATNVVVAHVGESHYAEWLMRMKLMYQYIQQIRERIKKTFYEAHGFSINENDLTNAIVSYYKESFAISSFFPDAETEIAKKVATAQ